MPFAVAQPVQNQTQNQTPVGEQAADEVDTNASDAADVLNETQQEQSLRGNGLVDLLQAILLKLHDLEERIDALENHTNITNATDLNETPLNETNETMMNETNETNDTEAGPDTANEQAPEQQDQEQDNGGGILPF